MFLIMELNLTCLMTRDSFVIKKETIFESKNEKRNESLYEMDRFISNDSGQEFSIWKFNAINEGYI